MTLGPIELFKNGIRIFTGEASPAPGGGAMAGALGPYPFVFSDFTTPDPLLVLVADAPAGKFLLNALPVIDTEFNDTAATITLQVYTGDPNNGGDSLWRNAVDITGRVDSPDPNGNVQVAAQDGSANPAVPFPILLGSTSPNPVTLFLNGNYDGDAGAGRMWLMFGDVVAP